MCEGVHEKRRDDKKENDVKPDGPPIHIVSHLTASKHSVMLQTVNVTVPDGKE